MSDESAEALTYRAQSGQPMKLVRHSDGGYRLEPYESPEELDEARRSAEAFSVWLRGFIKDDVT